MEWCFLWEMLLLWKLKSKSRKFSEIFSQKFVCAHLFKALRLSLCLREGLCLLACCYFRCARAALFSLSWSNFNHLREVPWVPMETLASQCSCVWCARAHARVSLLLRLLLLLRLRVALACWRCARATVAATVAATATCDSGTRLFSPLFSSIWFRSIYTREKMLMM